MNSVDLLLFLLDPTLTSVLEELRGLWGVSRVERCLEMAVSCLLSLVVLVVKFGLLLVSLCVVFRLVSIRLRLVKVPMIGASLVQWCLTCWDVVMLVRTEGLDSWVLKVVRLVCIRLVVLHTACFASGKLNVGVRVRLFRYLVRTGASRFRGCCSVL